MLRFALLTMLALPAAAADWKLISETEDPEKIISWYVDMTSIVHDDDYLRAFTLVLLDWAWQRIETQLPADTPERVTRWEAPAQALRTWVLPEGAMRLGIMDSLVKSSATA